MVVGPCQSCFLLWTSGLYISLYSPNWPMSICKISCECLSSSIWLRYLVAYLLFFWVPVVLLVLSRPIRLHCLLFCSTLPVFLLCILPLSNYRSTLLVHQLLLLCYSIGFSLLPISLSILYSSCIFLYQNNPKSFSLISQVIEFIKVNKLVLTLCPGKNPLCKVAKLQARIKPTALCSAIDKENSIEFSLDFLHYLYNYYMVCALLSHAYHVILQLSVMWLWLCDTCDMTLSYTLLCVVSPKNIYINININNNLAILPSYDTILLLSFFVPRNFL